MSFLEIIDLAELLRFFSIACFWQYAGQVLNLTLKMCF